jgi:nucleotide-binding universal stress UspA family protein
VSQIEDAPVRDKTAAQTRYDSLLVHVEAGKLSERRTRIAAHLARAFDARLIGLGAEAVEPLMPVDPFGGATTAEWIAFVTKQVAEDLVSAEQAFARDAQGCETEWRCLQRRPVDALADTARAADLIVAGATTGEFGDSYRRADVAELVLAAGRPVLVAPANAVELRARSIVVAWKDTREARRAVMDALPFLERAEEVVVLAVCDPDGAEAAKLQTKDVAAMLRRRLVPARSAVVPAPDVNVAEELNAEAAACGADLIVAGAYGHSRMAEWVLGGATRGLLRDPQRYLLLSH